MYTRTEKALFHIFFSFSSSSLNVCAQQTVRTHGSKMYLYLLDGDYIFLKCTRKIEKEKKIHAVKQHSR